MNLKAVIATAAVGATVFGGVATAEAKPQDKTFKHCKKNANGNSKRIVCETDGGETVEGVCPGSYSPLTLVELGPGNEAYDVNANGILCYDAALGTIDDKAHS
jgi:hypothetical protein